MLEAVIFSAILTACIITYFQIKILNKKIDLTLKNIILMLIFILLLTLNYVNVDNFIRILTTTIIVTLFTFLILREQIFKSFVSSFIGQLLLYLSEFVAWIIFSIFSINAFELSRNNSIFLLFVNAIIYFIAIYLFEIKFVKNLINSLFSNLNKINELIIYFIILIFIVTLNFLLILNYLNEKNYILIIINTLFMIIHSLILFILVNEKIKNKFYIENNKILLSNLNEYEKMLDYQRVNNHENKNQLLVIKSMIEKKDKKLMDYINEIIKEKREDNEIVYNMAKRIPSGGLQGLIYQKMLLMQENNIEISLDINNKVRKIDFEKLSAKMNYDICRIVGIIIDNAIEETVKFNKKEREIIISMYTDDDFIIEISNRIKDEIDLNKIYEKGYTSKKKGHGYGLSLLKKIVDENEQIRNEVKIVNNIFTQIVKIKM